MNTVFLNGKYVAKEKASVSVMDRGFLFGDGVYEVIPIYSAKLFTAKEHLTRFKRSLNAVQIQCPYNNEKLLEILNNIIEMNKAVDGLLYMQVSRGAAEERIHTFPDKNIKPSFFCYCIPYQWPTKKFLEEGYSVITAKDPRWQFCNIKSLNLLPNVMYAEFAKKAQAVDTIMIRDGYVTEATSSNVFIVKNKCLITAPEQPGMLSGITRGKIIEIAKKNNISISEKYYTEQELSEADEVWLTSSSKPIMPIVKVNGLVVGKGKTGALWQKTINWFNEEIVAC